MNGITAKNTDDEVVFDIYSVDDEHKFLRHILESIDSGIRENHNIEIIGEVLADLFNYMDKHFKDEEAQMEACGYPDIDKHRIDHQHLFARLNELMEDVAVYPKDSLLINIKAFVTCLLSVHVSGLDGGFNNWMKGRDNIVTRTQHRLGHMSEKK